MKQLWAPWRFEYIKGDTKQKGCIFCRPPKSEKTRARRLVLYVGNHSAVFMNKYPYINGHLLVVPKRHCPDLEDLKPVEILDFFETLKLSIRVLRKAMKPHGFNIGINIGRVAGAGIGGHIHYHVVPRFHGDNNVMAVLGECRVISQHIEDTYNQLLPHFQKEENKLVEGKKQGG